MMRSGGVIALSALLLAPHPAGSLEVRPAQIILIRHAEKPADPDNPHLSPAGVQRAARLVSFITTDPVMTRFGLPVAIFATRTTKRGNGQRTQETVAPLAAALKQPVQTPYLGKDYAFMAKRILSNPAYAGKSVLVCWNHEEMPALMAALGVRSAPPKWAGRVFDRAYVISYRNGTVALEDRRY